MYLSIDIGATYTKYGYYQDNGNCIKKDKMKTIKTNKKDFYQSLEPLITHDLKGIAISMHGLIDSLTGSIHSITLLPFFNQTSICHDLFQKFHLPVTVQNDAKCATLGEMWKGCLRDVDNGFMLVLGTGIGGTIIIHRKILETQHFKSGEIGSFLIPQKNMYSHFGREYNAVKLIHDLSLILHCPDDGEIVFQQLSSSQEAIQHFQNYCQQIAVMIYNLDYLLDLDVIAIGGGISEQPLLIQTIRQEFYKLRELYKEDNHEPIIKACQFQNEANLLGALYHHIHFKRSSD